MPPHRNKEQCGTNIIVIVYTVSNKYKAVTAKPHLCIDGSYTHVLNYSDCSLFLCQK